MQSQPIEKKFCTTREAASLLGVSIGSVQQWVERGLLEAWKTDGGHRRVLRESVNNLLNQKQVDLKAATLSAPVPLPEKPITGLRRLRVLAIDEEAAQLQLYKDTISGWGMAPEVSTCDSAVAGLVLIGRTCPDLLLVDLQMPGMDGFALLHILLNMPELKGTTMVVVSAVDAAALAQYGALPAGVHLLPKPVPFERLLTIAMDVASKSHLERRAS